MSENQNVVNLDAYRRKKERGKSASAPAEIVHPTPKPLPDSVIDPQPRHEFNLVDELQDLSLNPALLESNEQLEFTLTEAELNLHELAVDSRNMIRYIFSQAKEPRDVQKILRETDEALADEIFFSTRIPKLRKLSELAATVIAACTDEIRDEQTPAPPAPKPNVFRRLLRLAPAPKAPAPTNLEYVRRVTRFRNDLTALKNKADALVRKYT